MKNVRRYQNERRHASRWHVALEKLRERNKMAAMFEHHTSPLLPREVFYRRVAGCFLLGCSLLAVALGGGMLGYHFLEHLPWLDAFTSAAMILSGMGPVVPLQTAAGKLFAGCYALFSGLLFLSVAGLFLAPIAHRLLHKFHLEAEEKTKKLS